MDISKVDQWFKVEERFSVVTERGDGLPVVVFTSDEEGCRMISSLLKRWHSSTRSHPAMREERQAVSDACNYHHNQHHNADFEACDNLACRLALMLEQAYGGVGGGL